MPELDRHQSGSCERASEHKILKKKNLTTKKLEKSLDFGIHLWIMGHKTVPIRNGAAIPARNGVVGGTRFQS
jgi:hypothetical protein